MTRPTTLQHQQRPPPRSSRAGMCQGGDGVLQTLCGEFNSHPVHNFSFQDFPGTDHYVLACKENGSDPNWKGA
jgi:hypothetical protein